MAEMDFYKLWGRIVIAFLRFFRWLHAIHVIHWSIKNNFPPYKNNFITETFLFFSPELTKKNNWLERFLSRRKFDYYVETESYLKILMNTSNLYWSYSWFELVRYNGGSLFRLILFRRFPFSFELLKRRFESSYFSRYQVYHQNLLI